VLALVLLALWEPALGPLGRSELEPGRGQEQELEEPPELPERLVLAVVPQLSPGP
jgi:hypothetical protein